MHQFLSTMIGKKIDVFCGGGSSLRGEVMKVEEGVLHLKDDNKKMSFVNIENIHVVWEACEDEHRAGFVPAGNEK